MIHLRGSAIRSYIFPADLTTTFNYFNEYQNLFHWLKYIEIQEIFDVDLYRVKYSTYELNTYEINIYCDLAVSRDYDEKTISIRPVNLPDPIETHRGLYFLQSVGTLTSDVRLQPKEDHTIVTFSLDLSSEVPIPLGLRLFPKLLLDKLVKEFVDKRIHEIIDHLFERSIEEYRGI